MKPLMKRLLIAMLVMTAIWLTEFGATGLAIALTPTLVTDQSPKQPTEQLITTLRQDLSQRLKVSIDQVRLLSATQKTWSNGCLGLPKPGELCTQATIAGWRVVLAVDKRQWIYRSDRQGQNYRLEAP